jgi:hypothetical protein
MSFDSPSVRLLLDPCLQEMLESHGQVRMMRQLAQGFDLIDLALSAHLESGAAVAELSPADITDDGDLRPLVVHALCQMPPAFAALTGRTSTGELLRGGAFWQAARETLFKNKSADDVAVFYHFNLDVLRDAAPVSRPPGQSPTE